LSHFLKRHRQEYYDRLQAVRDDGDWERWLLFFLRGVRETATQASTTAARILGLREEYRGLLSSRGRAGGALLRALDILFDQPVINVPTLARRLNVTFAAANGVVERLVEAELLSETTGQRRNRRFAFQSYLRLFD
jgi:Fic family protein